MYWASSIGLAFNALAIQPHPRCVVDISFQSGSARLAEVAWSQLNKFVTDCEQIGEGIIVISGRSDAVGTPSAKLEISRARAEAVREYLLWAGIPRQILRVEALGDRLADHRRFDDPDLDEFAHAKDRSVFIMIERR